MSSILENGSQFGTYFDYNGAAIPPYLVKTFYETVQTRAGNQPTSDDFNRLQDGPGGNKYERMARELLQNFDAQVIFEDPDLLIVNKPPYITSHGSKPGQIGVEEIVRFKREQTIYLAHRLDAGTTGVLFLTKGFENKVRMSYQFADKNNSHMRKYYATLLDGELQDPVRSVVHQRIRQVGGTSYLMEVVPAGEEDPSSKDSQTIFRPLALLATPTDSPSYKTPTLVQLITGRTHQIRVVAAQTLGMPVTGDVDYGSTNSEFGRPLLHALRVDFNHPRTGEAQSVVAQIPSGMTSVINSLTMVRDYRRKK